MTRVLTIAAVVWLQMLRRKDVYVLAVLLGALLLMLVSLNIFGLGGMADYVKDVGLLAAWLLGWTLAVSVSTRELPQEETRGTVFALLAKPINRFQLIAGKWLGTWSSVALAVLAFYALVDGVVIARGGRFDTLALLQAWLLHAAALGIVGALGIALSTRLNRDAALVLNYVLTGAAFLVIPRVPELLVKETGFSAKVLLFLYYLVPHFELFDMRRRLVHGYGPMAWSVLAAVLVYALLFVAALLLAAWIAYHNKRFSRGSMAT
jgi:ABC-type transport system involved in multi-copper enzyme maturation permease subunit